MNIPDSLIRVAQQPVRLTTLKAGDAFKIPAETLARLIEAGWPENRQEKCLTSIFVLSSHPPAGMSSLGAFNVSLGEMCGFGDGDFDVLPVEIVVPSAS